MPQKTYNNIIEYLVKSEGDESLLLFQKNDNKNIQCV
jgi:hypothetical protein